MANLLVCFGVGLLAYALLNSGVAWVRRLGVWCLWGTVALAIWFFTGNIWAGVAAMIAWFLIPMGQAWFLSRSMRFSSKRRLTSGSIDFEEFPELNGLSRDMRTEGFVATGDYWLKPSPFEQGYRLFRHKEDPVYGAIAVVRQGGMAMQYVVIVSADAEGGLWITWDYPLAYGLKMPPHFRVYRCLDAENIAELAEQHREFLKLNEVNPVNPKDEEGGVASFFDNLFHATIRYNLDVGVLSRPGGKGDEVAYSVKGSLYIAWQVFRELVAG